jgi:tetratricopeptide (TPR) repeat protein
MQFSDQPNFSVAGVTDWTAVGGHGSDSTLRTTESLASATAALKSAKPSTGSGPSSLSPNTAKADKLRVSGEHFEATGDPLSAVRAFEQATTLDPSEANYFAWGSELLLHRAIWQAEEVFRKGTTAFPGSVRMQTALGTALFSGARYDEAAQRLCTASDLDPSVSEPYLFMGRMQIVAPNALTCVEPHLARFVAQQPNNSVANYLYAMALLKSQERAPNSLIMQRAESLLSQAVDLDPHCGDAYLELGILANTRHDTSQAILYFTSAVQATPMLADAHYRLGVLYDRTGDHEKARHEFQLHDQIKQQQATLTEQQRRDIKQFLFAKPGQPSPAPAP